MTRLRRGLCTAVAALLLPACAWETGSSDPRGGAAASPAFSATPAPPQATVALPRCKYPKKLPYPDWVPDDLPLPEGTYAYQHLDPLGGYKRAFFVLPDT